MSCVLTDKAWVAGWDAGVCCYTQNKNPYRRREFLRAWEAGRICGLRSSRKDVEIMKFRQERLCAAAALAKGKGAT